MFFELPWVGVAMDDMAVAISVKYSVCQNPHITYYSATTPTGTSSLSTTATPQSKAFC